MNSYFYSSIGNSSYAMMGSVVGRLEGDIDTVYSNAFVNSTRMYTGGIVGRSHGGSETDPSIINNCWFDGSIEVTQSKTAGNGIGGILAKTEKGYVTITDCLNTANITYTGTSGTNLRIGGIHGMTHTKALTTTINNCVNAGTTTCNVGGATVSGVNSSGNCSGWATTTNTVKAFGSETANYNGYKAYDKAKANLNFYSWKDETP